MSQTILFNTSTGGQQEGDLPYFVPDDKFAIYSPRVSGIRTFSEDGSTFFYPTLTDQKIISNTWFFSYDEKNAVFLDNWSTSFYVDFDIGATLLSENPRTLRRINHDSLGEIDLGYPDLNADGLWLFLRRRVNEISYFTTNIGWCWFSREYINSLRNSDFFWFADPQYMDSSTLSRLGGSSNFSRGQCVSFFSESAGRWSSLIANKQGDIFLSVITDTSKTEYYKIID
jgi:hypothetical protein